MDFKDMEVCLALEAERHFGRAAARLNMTQPPLSQRLAKVEAELGVRLFRRDNRGVAPTRAGAALIEDLRAASEALARGARRARRIGAGLAGELRLGFVAPAMDGDLPVALRRYREACPEVVLCLEELPTAAQLTRLRAGTLGAGFVRLFGRAPSDLSVRTARRDRYVLALPEGHALAGREIIDLGELAGQAWIFYPRSGQPELHDAVTGSMARAGAAMRVVQETAGKRAALALVAAGMGLTLVTGDMARQGRGGVAFCELGPGLPEVEISLVWPTGAMEPVLARFVELFGGS